MTQKVKLETNLTDEEKELLDAIMDVSRLLRKALEIARSKEEELQHSSKVVEHLQSDFEELKQKIKEHDLGGNYRRLCYIHGIIKGF